jgi:uncharacterized protein
VRVWVCANGHSVFPMRLLCPVCGSSEWSGEESAGGVVELVTELASGARLADVRLDSGPLVIAAVEAGVSPGSRVSLAVDEQQAITARPEPG